MHCYICEKTLRPGGTHYHVKTAVGICHNCGIGDCLDHSHRDLDAGSPLLCPSCARSPKEQSTSDAIKTEDSLQA